MRRLAQSGTRRVALAHAKQRRVLAASTPSASTPAPAAALSLGAGVPPSGGHGWLGGGGWHVAGARCLVNGPRAKVRQRPDFGSRVSGEVRALSSSRPTSQSPPPSASSSSSSSSSSSPAPSSPSGETPPQQRAQYGFVQRPPNRKRAGASAGRGANAGKPGRAGRGGGAGARAGARAGAGADDADSQQSRTRRRPRKNPAAVNATLLALGEHRGKEALREFLRIHLRDFDAINVASAWKVARQKGLRLSEARPAPELEALMLLTHDLIPEMDPRTVATVLWELAEGRSWVPRQVKRALLSRVAEMPGDLSARDWGQVLRACADWKAQVPPDVLGVAQRSLGHAMPRLAPFFVSVTLEHMSKLENAPFTPELCARLSADVARRAGHMNGLVVRSLVSSLARAEARPSKKAATALFHRLKEEGASVKMRRLLYGLGSLSRSDLEALGVSQHEVDEAFGPQDQGASAAVVGAGAAAPRWRTRVGLPPRPPFKAASP